MITSPLLVLILLAFSVAVTLAAEQLVSWWHRPAIPVDRSPATLGAAVFWMLLILLAGLIAARYAERTANPVLALSAFGLMACMLSLLRAFFYQQSRQQRDAGPRPDAEEIARVALHALTYCLFATVLYLIIAALRRRPAEPILFMPLLVGALLPDLDSETSALGRLLPPISRRLAGRFGHQQEWHTPATAALVATVTAPLIPLFGVAVWAAIPLGFLSHILLDLLHPMGVMLLWPATRTRYRLFGGSVRPAGGQGERRLTLALGLLTVLLLLLVGVGPAPPPAVTIPPYEQTLAQYRGLQGRSLALADVEGTWQATGRRVRDRFEILSSSGPSYIMRDGYTGRVFTAGRAASDNLYLDRIRVVAGSPLSIKAIEMQLRHEPLAAALPIVYQMQREPGLQHIYVSGDVVIPPLQGVVSATLPVDYAQTSLRKIRAEGPGHYSLRYLTAGELIDLADFEVGTADLVIVATYVTPASGPTVTPLPILVPTMQPSGSGKETAP